MATILPQIMQLSYGDGPMGVRRIKAGTTDVSVVIRIIDATDGTPVTDVVHDTSGIDLWYRREGAASTDITEASLSALTDAHSDGGFLHINDGWYRLDLPDAACAASASGVQIGGTVTGMVVLAPYIELVAYDPYDTVRLGLTALPNAAAAASGGLFTRGTGAGQINQSNNGRIDVDVAAIATDAVNAAALAADALAEINAQVVDGLATDTYAEPTGVPPATASLAQKVGTLYMMARNRVDVTASKKTYYDDGGAAEFEKDLSDDGNVYSESESNSV